jgi:hypothetical protein
VPLKAIRVNRVGLRCVSSNINVAKMRCQNFVFASILGLVALVAGDVQKWTDLSLKSRMNVINLDDQTFDQIITTERNYTTIGISMCLQSNE